MRNALGKGLEALIPEIGNAFSAAVASPEGATKIPVIKIKPNKYQTREKFNEAELKNLAASILEHGLAQPITVRPSGENGIYEHCGWKWTTLKYKPTSFDDAKEYVNTNKERIPKYFFIFIIN